MKKLKAGIIGLGGRGIIAFCPLLENSKRIDLVAVCDLNQNRLESLKNHFGERIKYFSSVEQMISYPELDAVIVATNDPDHKIPTIQSLEGGKHCLVEKPMAQTIEDCDEMIRVQRKTKKVLAIGFELRYCVMFKKMKEIIDRGDIGDIKLGWAIDNVEPGGNSFFHSQRKHKSFIKSLLLQKGCHTIDLLNWFMSGNPKKVFSLGGLDVFGKLYSPDKRCRDCEKKNKCPYAVKKTEKVFSLYNIKFPVYDSCVYTKDADVKDNSLVLIQYDNGKRAFYSECHFTPEYTREFTLIGDKGKIYGLYKNEEFLIRVSYRHSDHIDEYHPIFSGGGHGGGENLLLEDFVKCCLENKTPLVDGLAGRNATAVAIAAEESIVSGYPVEIKRLQK